MQRPLLSKEKVKPGGLKPSLLASHSSGTLFPQRWHVPEDISTSAGGERRRKRRKEKKEGAGGGEISY